MQDGGTLVLLYCAPEYLSSRETNRREFRRDTCSNEQAAACPSDCSRGRRKSGPCSASVVCAYFACGSGRNWKCTASGLVPLPPSISHGVRSPFAAHRPQPSSRRSDRRCGRRTPWREAERIRHADRDHLAVLVEGDQAVHRVGGRHRDVVAKAERVVLVDPRMVARLGLLSPMPLKPGPGYLWNVRPSGQWLPVACGPLSGPPAEKAIEHAHVAVASDTQTRPCLSMSPPRGPKPGSGTLYCSASDLCGFLVGSRRTIAPGLPRSVSRTEPSVGLASRRRRLPRCACPCPVPAACRARCTRTLAVPIVMEPSAISLATSRCRRSRRASWC